MNFTVYLEELNATWTPFHYTFTLSEAEQWANAKGINYQIWSNARPGLNEILITSRSFGKFVKRRNKKVA